MIEPTLVTAYIALSTLATMIFLGLGFLPRPSAPAAIWSLTFAGIMLASYLWAGADSQDSGVLRGAASGVMLGMISMSWVGLRERRSAPRWHWIVAIGFTLAMPAILALNAEAEYFPTVVRLAMAASGVFSGLTAYELIRLGPLWRDEALPLALASLASIALGVLGLVQEIVRLVTGSGPAPSIDAIRAMNTLGALVYLVCALVTFLLLTRRRESVREAGGAPFEGVANDRLRRAKSVEDRWWSLLVIRLDEPEALRDASSTHAFDHVVDAYASAVARTLPAESDIVARSRTEIVALLPRPEGAVRQVVATLLEAIADIGTDSPLAVRLSASVGWAQVDVVGYELHALMDAASAAADKAAALGGDRWYRITGEDLAGAAHRED